MMNALPKLKLEKTSDNRKDALKRWFALWSLENMDVDTAEIDDVPDGTITDEQLARLADSARHFDEELAPGQIRLLSPELVPDADRPYYVLLIRRWDDDMFLIAPFSPIPEPATRGELKTERDHRAISVIELWNARTVHDARLRESWLVDRASESEIDDASAVFAAVAAGAPLPERLRERVGLPVIHPEDPRIEYQKRESALLLPLLEKTLAMEKWLAKLEDAAAATRLAEFTRQIPSPADAVAAADAEDRSAPSKCVLLDADSFGKLLEMTETGETPADAVVAIPTGFEPLHPDYPPPRSLHWSLPTECALKGGEMALLFMTETHSLLGTGHVIRKNGNLFVSIDKIPAENVKRVVDTPADLALLVADV